MKNTAVLNGFGLKSYALEPLASGPGAFMRTLEYAGTLPGIETICVLVEDNSPALREPVDRAVRFIRVPSPFTVEELMRTLSGCGEGYDNLFYFYADTPFLDSRVTARMYETHRTYRAEYSFADGYPYGLTPEIIRTDILPALIKLAVGNSTPVYRDSIFTVIQKDINAFDIETDISPVDLRLLRLSFSCDTGAGTLLVNRFLEEKASTADEVMRCAVEKPGLLRLVPAFVNVQVMGGCPQVCTYCPFPGFGGDILSDRRFMPVPDFSRILDQVVVLSREAVISISLWGEPSLHPDIAGIVREVSERESLSLVIETSGIGWKREDLESIRGLGRQPLAWIISLDARDGTLYEKLRGKGFDEALRSADLFRELFPGRVWIQGVRMRENEDHLESFFKHFRDSGGQVIIQKYDHFCATLPDRKVTDLSPVNRFPCWHLKRDLTVLLDGSIPLCREDTGRAHDLGNVLQEPLETIWRRAERFYLDHTRETYPEICRKCDEYYTFNF